MSLERNRLGKYTLRRKLGQGGMGVVFLAVQDGLQREVALKVLPKHVLARGKDPLKRFLREASVCARLSHPNIVKIFDYGCEEGFYYYAMEVLRATSLEDRLKQEPLPPMQFIFRVMREMTGALAACHPHGIVHRDIKPANIMLDETGKAILTDFGLVKDLEATAITQEGAAVGTPYYMAPEQLKGQAVDGATDVYQLGVVLYRMATGTLPFHARNSTEVFGQILTLEPDAPSKREARVYPALENVILNCLEKDRAIRYRSAEELAADLELAARKGRVARRRDAKPQPAEPAVAPAPSPPPRPPARAPLVVAGVVALAALAYFAARPQPPVYAATDVEARAGTRRAFVEWKSPTEYGGQVEWGTKETPPALASLDSPGRLTHRVELAPLVPGQRYRYCIVFPDGTRSLEYTFETPASALEPKDVVLTPSGAALQFERPDLPGHRLDAPELRFRDAAGDEVSLSREELLAAFRAKLLPRLVAEVTRGLEGASFDRFLLDRIDVELPGYAVMGAMEGLDSIGLEGALTGQSVKVFPHYRHLKPGDPKAAAFAGLMRAHLESQPFAAPLQKLIALGEGIFDERVLPVEQAARLLAALQKVRDYDFYAGMLNIPFSSGVEKIFGRDFRVRYDAAFAGGESIEHPIPGSSYWGHPFKEYLLAQRTGMDMATIVLTSPYDWKPSLPDPAALKTVELSLLGVRLEFELLFQLSVNGRLLPGFRHESSRNREGKNTRAERLSMTIDPRFLRKGENVIHVEIAGTPGTRYLGLKRHNNLKRLRLAWLP